MMTGLPPPSQLLIDIIEQIRASFDDLNEEAQNNDQQISLALAVGGISVSIGAIPPRQFSSRK